jgi:CspA family cold shock protein
MAQREYGKCIFFRQDRGYGFIEPEHDGDDVWVHISRIKGNKPLQADQRVSYVISTDTRGRLQADDVRVE